MRRGIGPTLDTSGHRKPVQKWRISVIEKLTTFLTPDCARQIQAFPFYLNSLGYRRAVGAAERVRRIVLDGALQHDPLKCLKKLNFQDPRWYPHVDSKLRRLKSLRRVVGNAARVETTVAFGEMNLEGGIPAAFRSEIRFYAKAKKEPLATLTLCFYENGALRDDEGWLES